MPRYDRYEKMRRDISGSVKRGEVSPTWGADGKSLSYTRDGKTFRYDFATNQSIEGPPVEAAATPPARRGRRGGGGQGAPARGRQFSSANSPDETLKAFYRDRNLYISKPDGTGEVAVTTEGNEKARTKYGIASWVYGEELGVREAMWWSPDSKKLAFYGFDESKVKDYFLAMSVLGFQDQLDVEAYPKAGSDNPDVELFVYDVASKQRTKVEVKFGNVDLAHYVYSVRWSPKGEELLFNRMNRKQNSMEFCAADPNTGKCRAIIKESWPQSWVDPTPDFTWLEDQKSFITVSERNGYRNLYLANLTGDVKPITQHLFEVASIVRIDEKAKQIWYMARDGETYYKYQLHKVGFDGKGDKRLTDPKYHHTVNLSPDGKYFTDVAQTIDTPPTTRLVEATTGKQVAVLAESDLTRFNELALQKAERLKFKAADGVTDIYGYLFKPSDFDASKKYPLIVNCYGGPESGSGNDAFRTPDPTTEFGFLVAWVDNRGTSGRGKAFKDSAYGKLGVVEIDDHAALVKHLRERPYVDGKRVGIQGTSYGGYTTVMALLRHPDVFQVGVASSAVTDWRNYDTIYTERFMGLPWDSENKAGYEAGSAMTYAKNLKGKLLLYYGTADNNVHPANSYQLASALQKAGKGFYMMAGADAGHSGVDSRYMWEFFIDHLILHPSVGGIDAAWNERKQRIAARG